MTLPLPPPPTAWGFQADSAQDEARPLPDPPLVVGVL